MTHCQCDECIRGRHRRVMSEVAMTALGAREFNPPPEDARLAWLLVLAGLVVIAVEVVVLVGRLLH